MAKPRLKVFHTQMGFVEVVVAAPSQTAALEAWGARQNLFAEKMAGITDEAAAVEAALAKPGVVLRRAIGSKDRFAETAALPVSPDAPAPKSKAAAKKAPPPPDRSALTAAEAALARIDREAEAAMSEIAEARKRLDAREDEVNRTARARRRDAVKTLDQARRTFVEKGGKPSARTVV